MRMRILKDECGQVLVMSVLSMFVLLGCVALAVDVGMLFRTKRQVQIAADSAAIAAALEYRYHGSANVVSTGKTAGSQNGVAASEVTVTIGPTSGYHMGSGYVEAKVVHPNPMSFMRAFGFRTVNVGARSVAGITPAPSCMISLDTRSGLKSSPLWVKGNSTVTATNCGIQVNNSSNTSFCDQGSAQIKAPYVRLNGGQSTSGQCAKNPSSPVLTGSGITPDPFKNLTGPVPLAGAIPNDAANSPCKTSNTYTSTTAITSTAQLKPALADADGIASDGIRCFTGSNITFSNVTLPAGIYVFTNGVNIGNGVVFGNKNNMATGGATIDVYGGTFNDQNGTLAIYAPANTSAKYNSLAIMQPSLNTTGQCQDSSISNKINTTTCLQVEFGSSGSDLEGIVYAPAATVYLQDEGGTPMTAAAIIADDMYINGTINITNNYSTAFSATTPLSSVQMVE